MGVSGNVISISKLSTKGHSRRTQYRGSEGSSKVLILATLILASDVRKSAARSFSEAALSIVKSRITVRQASGTTFFECLTVPMLLHTTIECSAGLDLYAIDLHNQTMARAWFDASVSMRASVSTD
jgi:hypothetical protein